jgi:peptide deformylase
MEKNPEIITYDSNQSATLRQKAEEVKDFDMETKDVVNELKKVFEAEKRKESGIVPVGLAAPQIGIPKRIFVVNLNDVYYVFVNPVVKSFGKTQPMIEGCLSFPDIYVKVDRPEKVKVKYFNEQGQSKKLRAQDFMAKVIQHENDHIDGILLSDKDDFKEAGKIAARKGIDIKEILNEKYFSESNEEE